jgi:hypothetical protein
MLYDVVMQAKFFERNGPMSEFGRRRGHRWNWTGIYCGKRSSGGRKHSRQWSWARKRLLMVIWLLVLLLL